MRALLIALVSFALAGCWEGEAIYADTDARPSFESGLYRMTPKDEQPAEVRITTLSNGLTQLESEGEKVSYGLAPLDAKSGTFVAWSGVDKNNHSGEQVFLLVERQTDGSFILYALSCDGEEAKVAQKVGATVEEGVVPTCRFHDRKSLESALRKYRPSEDRALMRFERNSDH